MRDVALRVLYSLFGNPRRQSLEHRLFNAITLMNGVANLAGSLNVYSVNMFVLFLTLGTGGVFFLFYYLSRFRSIYRSLFWPLIILMAVFLLANSLQNAASLGGAHYYLIPAAVIAAMLSRSLLRTLGASLLLGAFAGVMFYIEWNHKEWVLPQSPKERILDVPAQFVFILFFCGILTMVLKSQLDQERAKSERLLRNILPDSVADELKLKDRVTPLRYESATVLFTDFVGFTRIAEQLTPEELVGELDDCFRRFDQIMERHGLEKIKTIGDAYMAAGGLPRPNDTHVPDAVAAALEIQAFMAEHQREREAGGMPSWELRVGIHTGPLVAGVIGEKKFVYDIWGDTVNVASRLEAAGTPGRVNISRAIFEQIHKTYRCEYRGAIVAKNKGEIDMYYVLGPRSPAVGNSAQAGTTALQPTDSRESGVQSGGSGHA